MLIMCLFSLPMSKNHSKLIISSRTELSYVLLFLLFSLLSHSSSASDPFDALNAIDDVVTEAIQDHEFPGCQVLVMKNGQTIFDKSYGFLTYDSLQEVTGSTIYDIASITKVAATTYMIMSLYENGRIRLDDPIVCYLPEYLGSNKEKITVRQLLAHNGKLRSYLPFWEQTLEGDMLDPACDPLPITPFGIQPSQFMADSIKNWIISSPLGRFRGRSKYRYSDIGFMVLQQVAESASGQSMEQYLNENFYQPLALQNLMFNPLKKGVPFHLIAPTEYDLLFRFNQVWGEVHDRNAAILGGISGHAGLFSNSKDLAQLMNLMLTPELKFEEETIAVFTESHFQHNRRGLGWDRKNERISSFVSEDSFGHKGFTGTMAWVDPDEELVYIFLSNRVYPNAENRKLITNKTRERLQDIIYQSILLKRGELNHASSY